MPRRPVRALGVSLAVLLLVVGASELCYRACAREPERATLRKFRHHLLTGEMREYEPRAHTVFQRPRRGTQSNSLGFSGDEWSRARTPGVPRVVCLGGSTTEGGNASAQGTYPYLLELELEARSGRDFEVFNAGISGWTTAEMLVSWFLTLQDLAPDVLVLHEAVNDLPPRFSAGFVPDYSHWRRPVETHAVRGLERLLVRSSDLYVRLRLRAGEPADILTASTYPPGPVEPLVAEGKLPHATSLAFRRNIANVARSARDGGATVVLMTLPTGPAEVGGFWRDGVAQNNRHLRELCAELGLLLVDAAQAFQERTEMGQHFTDMVHLEIPGNRFKAELVADGLADWLAALPAEGARPPGAAGSPEKKRRTKKQ